jgi:hypothetical protein
VGKGDDAGAGVLRGGKNTAASHARMSATETTP